MPPDEASFRTVLGHFATGVTIITAMNGDEPVGVSANAFTSVSIDPPLILFCASKSSSTLPKIEAAGKFTVNILNEHQEDVCRVFATKGADRFTRIGWRPSANGNPILHDALAYVDCTIERITTAATTTSWSGASPSSASRRRKARSSSTGAGTRTSGPEAA